MVVSSCPHEFTKKHGRDRKGNPRLRCTVCGKTWSETGPKPLGDMRISLKDAATVLGLLLEGMSIRAAARITGIDRNTISDLILLVGANCERFLHDRVQGVAAKDIQADELWSFVGMKEKTRVARRRSEEFGDSWTFVAIDRDTKLVLAHHIGQRDNEHCEAFIRKLDRAVSGRFQLSTDGLSSYTWTVPFVLGSRVDFGQLVKKYSASQEVTRYSPATIISAEKRSVFGNPDFEQVCTSHIERMNLSIRMHLRRFTRLTNAHSKSLDHHAAMQSIFFAWFNFCRKHEAIGTTPALRAGIANEVWTLQLLLKEAA